MNPNTKENIFDWLDSFMTAEKILAAPATSEEAKENIRKAQDKISSLIDAELDRIVANVKI